ncbi:hypothetical protein DENSPDRAFT_263057 [Dentipellis sp. KUC8613]|nr:hypothetical protein DENSPDRAFT_263057 [Dentipellis sp. KUC8613]
MCFQMEKQPMARDAMAYSDPEQTMSDGIHNMTGCLVLFDIRGAYARPLALAPREHDHDNVFQISNLYTGSSSLDSAVHASPVSRVQFRAVRAISVPLVPGQHDIHHFASLFIGSNPQLFHVIADAASSDFWVYPSTSPTRGTKNNVTAPAVRGTRPAGFGYEGGVTLKAGVVRDVVDFGPGGAFNIPFAAATEVSAIFAGRPEKGVMGFGLVRSNQGGSGMGMPPIVNLLASSGLIYTESNMFDMGELCANEMSSVVPLAPALLRLRRVETLRSRHLR